MRKRYFRYGWLAVVVLSLSLAGCPVEEDLGDIAGSSEILPVEQDPIDPNDSSTFTPKKVAGGGTPVVHEVWMGIDTNTDPRCPIGYKLASSGKQYFDNVIIFHAGLAAKNCGSLPNPAANNFCPKTGLHLHWSDEIQWLIHNWDDYIKPLKDAGMKVLLGLLPYGHGVCFGSLGGWPMETVWSWAEHYDGQLYPYDAVAARAFAKEVADACKEYGFDGIALDDEYGNQGDGAPADGSGRGEYLVYPEYSGSQYTFPPGGASAAWKEGGKNVFKFCRYFKEYTTDSDHPNGLWVSNYEYHYLANLPSSLEVDSDNGSGAGNGNYKEYKVQDVVDASYVAQYGSQVLSSQIGMPRSQYGFLSIAFDAFTSVTTPPNMIKSAMRTQLKNNYGAIMYFALRERSNYSTSTYFGNRGDQPETYLSQIAEVLYQDTVVYQDQPDYPKFPVSRNGSTAGTGALYGHTD